MADNDLQRGGGARKGWQRRDQGRLFYEFRLEDRIPENHLLRRVGVFVTHNRISPFTARVKRQQRGCHCALSRLQGSWEAWFAARCGCDKCVTIYDDLSRLGWLQAAYAYTEVIAARDGPGVPSNCASHFAGEVKGVAKSSMPSIAAAMRYRDVGAASDWLCAAFGFHKHLVATSETGVVHYAQLTFGDAMLMLAPVRDGALDRYIKQPDEIGGAETQSCYVLVDDADAHYARAKASGAEIIVEIQDDDFGGRSYACRDPESHIWNFGTYDPWQGKRAGERQSAGRDSRGIRRLAVASGLLAAIAASVVVAGVVYGALRPGQHTPAADAKEAAARATRAAQERLNTESSARQAAEHATSEAKEQLGRERLARESAERAAAQLERERTAREAAERVANEAREQLSRERSAKNAALKAAAQLRRQLIQVQNAKQQAGETYVDPESAAAEPKSAPARPKKQKAKAQSTEE